MGDADKSEQRIAVIGLGYVGLPLALALARTYDGVVGYDEDAARVTDLRAGRDRTGEISAATLAQTRLALTSDPAALVAMDVFVVAVPTPIDANRQPDLSYLVSASTAVGAALRPGALVVFESTVYPGVTEDICGPALEAASGLKRGRDFKLAYSPERINPGDPAHSLDNVVKIVSGEDDEALARTAALYQPIIHAGLHRAPSIKVAEAAKVIENTQRDLNIALMNELAIIFDRMGLRTRDVLAAAGTKWNFLKFHPGLVGGHCIGVDPYYLTAKAETLGYHPEVILAGRRINDSMGVYVAQRLVKLLIRADRPVRGARIGILGLTYKGNVPDLRNTRVPDIVAELRDFGVEPLVHDPLADQGQALAEYGLTLSPLEALTELDGLVLAVAHDAYLAVPPAAWAARLVRGGVIVDVPAALLPAALDASISYWSL